MFTDDQNRKQIVSYMLNRKYKRVHEFHEIIKTKRKGVNDFCQIVNKVYSRK